MRKFKIIPILIAVALFMNIFMPLARADELPEFLAEVAFLAEAESGTVLFESNADVRRAPDSLAKLMTLLLAAEAVESGRIVAAEVMDNLYATILGSDDEACDAVAVTVAGSVEDFVAAMNDRAAVLGCRNTLFVNTTGAADARQYTTARDLYYIAREGAKHAIFVQVAGARSYDGKSNTNYILEPDREKYYYRHCVFGKVSATYENGYGAVEYAERDGMNTVAIILGAAAVTLEDQSTEMQNLTEARRLLEWGHANYSWVTALSTIDLVARAEVLYGDGADFVNLRPQSEIVLLLKNDLTAGELVREIRIFSEESGEPLSAPIEEETVLGEIAVLRGGTELGRVPLVAVAEVRQMKLKYLQAQLKEALSSPVVVAIIVVVALILLVYIVLIVRYQALRAKHAKELAARRARAQAEIAAREE